MSTNKANLVDLGVIRINPQASVRVQGDSFVSWKKHAIESASLIENLQIPARMHVLAGSEHRVTTAASLLVVTRQASEFTCNFEQVVIVRRPVLTAKARTIEGEIPD